MHGFICLIFKLYGCIYSNYPLIRLAYLNRGITLIGFKSKNKPCETIVSCSSLSINTEPSCHNLTLNPHGQNSGKPLPTISPAHSQPFI